MPLRMVLPSLIVGIAIFLHSCQTKVLENHTHPNVIFTLHYPSYSERSEVPTRGTHRAYVASPDCS